MSHFENQANTYITQAAKEVAAASTQAEIIKKGRLLGLAIEVLDEYIVLKLKAKDESTLHNWLRWNWESTPKAIFIKWLEQEESAK